MCIRVKWSREIEGKLWRYPGPAGWRFVTLPAPAATEIRALFGGGPGWGSIRVEATIGRTTWKTSIFPDKESDSYLLPIKKEVRTAEDIEDDQVLRFRIMIAR